MCRLRDSNSKTQIISAYKFPVKNALFLTPLLKFAFLLYNADPDPNLVFFLLIPLSLNTSKPWKLTASNIKVLDPVLSIKTRQGSFHCAKPPILVCEYLQYHEMYQIIPTLISRGFLIINNPWFDNLRTQSGCSCAPIL